MPRLPLRAAAPRRVRPALVLPFLSGLGLSLWVGVGDAASGSPPPPCTGRVEALAKDISDRPELMDLKRKLASAAVRCTEGRTEEADRLLGEVERELKAVKRQPAQQGGESDRSGAAESDRA